MVILASAWFWWLVVAIAFFIVELVSGISIGFSLAVGSIVAMLLSFTGMAVEWQIVCGIIAAAICFAIVFALPSRKKNKGKAKENLATNMDAVIGREAKVVEAIKSGATGRVKLDGDTWQAEIPDGGEAEVGDRVRITGYDSIILKAENLKQTK